MENINSLLSGISGVNNPSLSYESNNKTTEMKNSFEPEKATDLGTLLKEKNYSSLNNNNTNDITTEPKINPKTASEQIDETKDIKKDINNNQYSERVKLDIDPNKNQAQIQREIENKELVSDLSRYNDKLKEAQKNINQEELNIQNREDIKTETSKSELSQINVKENTKEKIQEELNIQNREDIKTEPQEIELLSTSNNSQVENNQKIETKNSNNNQTIINPNNDLNSDSSIIDKSLENVQVEKRTEDLKNEVKEVIEDIRYFSKNIESKIESTLDNIDTQKVNINELSDFSKNNLSSLSGNIVSRHNPDLISPQNVLKLLI